MYVVDGQLCVGCRVCLNSCSRGALSMVRDVAAIDQRRCGECGGCRDACPQDAICELNKPRRTASACRPMYGIESPFPAPPPEPSVEARPSLLGKLAGKARRRRP